MATIVWAIVERAFGVDVSAQVLVAIVILVVFLVIS